MKLSPQALTRAHEAVRRVESIDSNIKSLRRNIHERTKDYDEKIRSAVERMLLGNFTDKHLGETVLCAVVNELLAMRKKTVDENSDIVDFSEPPCVAQIVRPDT